MLELRLDPAALAREFCPGKKMSFPYSPLPTAVRVTRLQLAVPVLHPRARSADLLPTTDWVYVVLPGGEFFLLILCTSVSLSEKSARTSYPTGCGIAGTQER